jgi:hypothetical protein
MKIKIVKRSDCQKIEEKISSAECKQPKKGDARRAMAKTIEFWVEDLRQKRDQERLSAKTFFEKAYAT